MEAGINIHPYKPDTMNNLECKTLGNNTSNNVITNNKSTYSKIIITNTNITTLYSYQLLNLIAKPIDFRSIVNDCHRKYGFSPHFRNKSDYILSQACKRIIAKYKSSFFSYIAIRYRLKKQGYSNVIESADHAALFNYHRNHIPSYQIQSGEDNSLYRRLNEYINLDKEYIINLVEDTVLLINDIVRSENLLQLTLALARYTKTLTKKSLFSSIGDLNLIEKFCEIFNLISIDNMTIQSGEFDFDAIKDYLKCYEKAKSTQLYKKMYKFTMYALTLSLFGKFGISLESMKYSLLEREAMQKKYFLGPDFIHCMIDTITFLCERGQQCMKTGTMEPLFHSPKNYNDWLDTSRKLKRDSTLMSNPEPHGLNRFSFLADLKDAIEKGNSIVKFSEFTDSIEKKIVQSILNDLQMIESVELTKRAAMRDRKAPFPVLIYGNSSIGKSTLTKILFYQYGKIMGLDTGAEFKHTRNPNDKFWSGFNSTQWCVQLDDISFLNPNIAMGGDPSVMEMLNIVNNVPFVPTQADLADKGRTPLLAKFVIATTNTIHLNAQAYFSCPLAVQRRLPFIVSAKPKPEYVKDGHFLDSSKVPLNEDGTYPDYWHFVISKVIPGNKPHLATIADIAEYDNINDFIKWFSKTAIKYEADQSQVMESDENMKTIQLCKNCYLPIKTCTCSSVPTVESGEVFLGDNFDDMNYINTFMFYWLVLMTYMYSIPFVRYLSHISGLNAYYETKILEFGINSSIWTTLIKRMGRNIQRKIGTNLPMSKLAQYLTVSCGLILLLKKLYNMYIKTPLDSQTVESLPIDIGKPPVPDSNERFNPWYKDDYVTTSFDVNPMVSSYKGLEHSVIKNKILNNCCHLDIHYTRNNELKYTPTKAFCIGGNKYILNNHALRDDVDQFRIKMRFNNSIGGISTNPEVFIKQSEIKRNISKDICCVTIYGVPPKKDLSQLFPKESFKGKFVGEYLFKDKKGNSSQRRVDNIYRTTISLDSLSPNIDVWKGTSSEVTEFGDCGSILFSITPSGPMILGLHVAGDKSGCIVSLNVTSNDLSLFDLKDKDLFGGGQPELCSGEIKRELTTLHNKSVVKYTEQGCANVYGSFLGYRPKHKSSVCLTEICSDMILDRYTIKHGSPIMNGWEPWRIAFVEMVEPINQLCAADVDQCVDSFYQNIIDTLPKDELSKIHILDDYTTINGAAGVTYIDKINRSTSMGNPWKCSKKLYLSPDLIKWGVQDPVKFDSEIMDRVDMIINRYHNKQRAFPNFCAHLKDEATSYAKIESKKTRVFTGAPVDWSIVVRKYLLSVVRVMQRNRFVFESAPGTIAQSREWGDIYQYLTKFGKTTLVAGDYSKFDKRMPPVAILGAFRIIEQLCEKAGYSDKDLLVIRGIAYDTAYPLVDFNGDLIEFYGSNPSGHPLTVIINGLVNCIYIRYSYIKLNPKEECLSFKDNVSLITYGDDNAMGVHPNAPWFNHTDIARVLADINIKYTMADKEAISIPYININQVSFLKRTWIWNDDINNYLCPLEEDSINKMLTVCVKSKTISPIHQSIAVMSCAEQEYFNYGKAIFTERRAFFLSIVNKRGWNSYLESTTFPTWEELVTRFNQ